jgi:GDPmannose 4,6-dehydratase
MTTALITGITGQDGSYLAEFLLEKEYRVIGMERRNSNNNHQRIEHLIDNYEFELVSGDLLDQSSIINIIDKYKPDEVYNLAAQSFVPVSWKQPIFTSEVTGLGVLRVLEAIKQAQPNARFYQASTSEMFGKVKETPQNELTPFYPRSPYGVAKVYGHWITINYRESYDMFATAGILFNHESPRRGDTFVTRKISKAVARISLGLQSELRLGNLDSKRDWGYAGDYVKAMWMMLQHDKPDTFVIGTDATYSVRDFIEIAFGYVGLVYEDYVRIDPEFYRPAEIDLLISDSSKARNTLGWKPDTSFKELVEMMVDYDLWEARDNG